MCCFCVLGNVLYYLFTKWSIAIVQLRNYQKQDIDRILLSLKNNTNCLYVLPTGGGKTVVKSHTIIEFDKPTIVQAHRQELVMQISKALAVCGVKHDIIAPNNVIRRCIQTHIEIVGKNHYRPGSHITVAGVDTITRRDMSYLKYKIELFCTDEAHHLLPDNKWGKATGMFPKAVLFGVTATPARADGKNLDGCFDTLIEGPTMRELITDGYLTDYKIVCPTSDVNLLDLKSGKDGDFAKKELKKRMQQSHIVGDVVSSYLQFAKGKRGVTFATDIETGQKITDAYNKSGIPAQLVHAGTTDKDRDQAVKKLETGTLLQLVNVDIFGEGFDLPAIEVVTMARPTKSWPLYVQQFGRVLRLLEGKLHGLVIDHVGNFLRHGPPDKDYDHSLINPFGKNSKSKSEIPFRICNECLSGFMSYEKKCPYCGFYPTADKKSSTIEVVEGNLTELPAELLEAMRRKVETKNDLKIPYHASKELEHIIRGKHRKRKVLVSELQNLIDRWAGVNLNDGLSRQATYSKFYNLFGIDTLTCQSYSIGEIKSLMKEIENDF